MKTTAEEYSALRELELAQDVQEAQNDYQAGRIASSNIDGHMQRIDNDVY
ncbi:MAG: hypothetical protein WC340_03120 [Kiritimatiellia bacterium]|jgi:hypothetical protein